MKPSLFALAAALVLTLPAAPGAHALYPPHGSPGYENERTRAEQVGEVFVYFHQDVGCGFSRDLGGGLGLWVYFYIGAEHPSRGKFDFGDGSEPMTWDAPHQDFSWSEIHEYPVAPQGVTKKYNPTLVVNGVTWTSTDASSDKGPWEVWVVGRKPGWLYLGHDQAYPSGYFNTDATVVQDNAVYMGRETFVGQSDGSFQADYSGNALSVDLPLIGGVGSGVDIHLRGQVAQKFYVDTGCSFSPNGRIDVRFNQEWDASGGGTAGVGTSRGRFVVTVDDGTASAVVFDDRTSGLVIPAGERWIQPPRVDVRNTLYEAGRIYEPKATYELFAEANGAGSSSAVSMGKDMPDYESVEGLGLVEQTPLTRTGLIEVTFDWESDLSGWQG